MNKLITDAVRGRACGRGWRLRWGLTGLLLLVAVLGPTSRAVAADGLRELTRYSSRYYTIHTNLLRTEAVSYGAHMDLVFASYAKRLRTLRGKKQDRQNLYLLRTHADYIKTLQDIGLNGTGLAGSSSGLANGRAWPPGWRGARVGERWRCFSTRAFTSSPACGWATSCRSGSTKAWPSISSTPLWWRASCVQALSTQTGWPSCSGRSSATQRSLLASF